jgi:GNAT superfamily N-acetyltransferase
MNLSDGYHHVPGGKLAAVVTSLEMLAPVAARTERADEPAELLRVARPEPDWYRDLFRRIGMPWLWHSRLALSREQLAAILQHPDNEVYVLTVADRQEGLLELDFRVAGECELAFFGLAEKLQGRGAGRWLMNRAIERAWARPIGRFWVHTCTLDHPAALEFYMRSGFRAYARQVEVFDDPRLGGLLPSTAAASIPLIRP